jgi:agmatinase
MYDADKVNEYCELLNSRVEHMVEESIKRGHIVAAIGGCHSSIYGVIAAHSKHFKRFSILQIDAHLDLCDAYEGVKYSHASIMRNILENIPEVTHLTSVGARSYGLDEYDYAEANRSRISVFYDDDIREQMYSEPMYHGAKNWHQVCKQIIDSIPTNDVYISFDHDGLEIQFSGSTGTPVSGGLTVWQMKVLFEMLAMSGKRIIGFDLNELVPETQNDRNSAAEIFYQMYYWTVYSQGGFPNTEKSTQMALDLNGEVSQELLPRNDASSNGVEVRYGGLSH